MSHTCALALQHRNCNLWWSPGIAAVVVYFLDKAFAVDVNARARLIADAIVQQIHEVVITVATICFQGRLYITLLSPLALRSLLWVAQKLCKVWRERELFGRVLQA